MLCLHIQPIFCCIHGKYSSTLCEERVLSSTKCAFDLLDGIHNINILSPGVNPWKIVTSTLNPKTGHSHNCVAPTKVSEIHIDDCEAWQVMTHLEKSPPPESPLQVSLVPSPAHSLVAPIVTRLTCRQAWAHCCWVTICTGACLQMRFYITISQPCASPQAVGGSRARGGRPPANDDGLRSSEY